MREQIFLSKNYTVIESEIPFILKFNVKDNTAASAEDVINFKSGWYIFDNNKLLPQYVDGVYNLPKYNCWIEYDETLPANVPHWYTCYINPKSVESLSAEQTELDSTQLAILRQDIQINGAKVDNFAAATHEDLGAVKSSVDAFQVSTHEDLGVVKSSVDAFQVSTHEDLGAVKSSVDAFKSDLLNGVPGTSKPLSFYLDENLKFTKATRYLISRNPIGFSCDWSLRVGEVLLNGWFGVYTLLPMELCFRLYDGDSLVNEKFHFIKAGSSQFNLVLPTPPHPSTVPYQLNILTPLGDSETISFDLSASHATRVLIYSHIVDSYGD